MRVSTAPAESYPQGGILGLISLHVCTPRALPTFCRAYQVLNPLIAV